MPDDQDFVDPYLLESLEVKLWDETPRQINFFSDVNFLIGPNGSGKTTVIRLINALVGADFQTMRALPFSNAKFTFRHTMDDSMRIIQIVRHAPNSLKLSDLFNSDLEISVSDLLDADDLDTVSILSTVISGRNKYGLHLDLWGTEKSEDPVAKLSGLLRSLVQATWLSVHRGTLKKQDGVTFNYDSTIDQRLADIGNRFNQFITEVDSRTKELSEEFQRQIFLNLTLKGETGQFDIASLREINLTAQHATMEGIFHHFQIDAVEYSQALSKHIGAAANAIAATRSEASEDRSLENLSPSQIISIASVVQTQRIIELWKKYQSENQIATATRDLLVKILNQYMPKKEAYISNQGQMLFFSQRFPGDDQSYKDRALFWPSELSSGEKQIYILFCEAALQRRNPVLYLLDEPELSLHISWQERLVESLRMLNPNAQIIAATHSPDVIADFTDLVHNLGDPQ